MSLISKGAEIGNVSSNRKVATQAQSPAALRGKRALESATPRADNSLKADDSRSELIQTNSRRLGMDHCWVGSREGMRWGRTA